MERVVKSGAGWRIGTPMQLNLGLVGTDDWAIELTETELNGRLSGQLVETISQLASELMDEEKISCEAERIYSGYKWKAILTLTICA